MRRATWRSWRAALPSGLQSIRVVMLTFRVVMLERMLTFRVVMLKRMLTFRVVMRTFREVMLTRFV